MRTFLIILAILGILGGVVGTLTMITIGLAARANNSQEDFGRISRYGCSDFPVLDDVVSR
jgi:hypothetical protein